MQTSIFSTGAPCCFDFRLKSNNSRGYRELREPISCFGKAHKVPTIYEKDWKKIGKKFIVFKSSQ